MSGKREPGILYGPAALNAFQGAPVVNVGTGTPLYAGQLGEEVDLTDTEVIFNPSIGTLYGGRYKLVVTNPLGTATPALGLCAFWVNRVKNVVSADAAQDGAFAGVFLQTVTLGNQCVVCIGGRVNVQFAAGMTPAAGLVVAQTAGANTFDVVGDAGTWNPAVFKRVVGRCLPAAEVTYSGYGNIQEIQLGPQPNASPGV